jgi:hypothetical protein
MKTDDLTRIAEAVAERSPIEWTSVSPADESERRALENLRALERIRSVHEGSIAESGEATRWVAFPDDTERSEEEETWGPLVLQRRLDSGKFGEVYLARDPHLDTLVALKLPILDDGNEAERVLKEAKKLARIRHRNVLTVYGAALQAGRVGLWTELIRGHSLEKLLERDGPFSAEEAARIGRDLCAALAAVHRQGLVHGDIKTSNVMREEGGRTVLIDFGGACRQPDRPDTPFEEGRGGTPLYMAPEILRGDRNTRSSDLYSLGVLLYRLVSREYPVIGANAAEIAAGHAGNRRRPLRDVRPDLPSRFIEVVETALSPDPQRRYRSAGDMESALGRFLGGEPRPGPRRSRGLRVLVAAATLASAAVAFLILAEIVRPFQVEANLFRIRGDVEERLLPGSRIAPGEQLFLELRGNRPLHAYVINQEENGRGYLLFPLHGLDAANPLAAGKIHRLPGLVEGIPNYWDVTSAGGSELLFVVASRRPLGEMERLLARFASAQFETPPEIPESEVIRLRGLAGHSPQKPGPGSGDDLSRLLQGLTIRTAREKGVWVWEMRLANPVG